MSHSSLTSSRCSGSSSGPQGPANVVLATGEFVWKQTNLEIAGRGINFEWTLNYRSHPEEGQPSWQHSYRILAKQTVEGIAVWDGSGQKVIYSPDTAGTYTADGVAAEGKLARGAFRLRFADGGVWSFQRFDAQGALAWIEKIEDQNRNALQFEYGATGLLEAVLDSLGRKISVVWDRRGRLASVTDFTGRQVQYRYNATGQLESVRYPAVTETPTGNNFARGAAVSFGYDTAGLLNAVSGWAGEASIAVEYGQGGDGRPQVQAIRRGSDSATFLSYEADPAGTLVTTNDPVGNVRDYLFNAGRRCVRMRIYNGRADATKPTRAKNNRPGKPLRQGESDFHETRFVHHGKHGWLLRKELPGGGIIVNEFELERNPAASALERGNLRAIRYQQESGDAELVRRFEYLAGFGCGCGEEFVTKETDFRGAVTAREFDHKGNLVRKVDRNGMVTSIRRNSAGAMVERVFEATASTPSRTDRFQYSTQHGQLVSEILDATGLRVTTTYRYDDLGRPLAVRDPEGNDHTHVWNAWDRLVRRVLPDGTTEDAMFDGSNRKTGRMVTEAGVKMRELIARDSDGRIESVTKEAGRNRRLTQTFEFDGNGNRTAQLRGEAEFSHLVYDTRGLPLRRNRGKGARGTTETSFTYDERARLVAVTRGTGNESTTLRTTYDGYGRLESMEFPDGGKSVITNDDNGNAILITKFAAGQNEPIESVSQVFDSKDRLISRIVRRGTNVVAEDRWKFDGRGRLIEQTVGGVSQLFEYDALDRCIRKAGDGRASEFTYDRNSNMLTRSLIMKDGTRRLETRFQLDRRGRTVREEGPGGWFWEGTIGHRDRLMATATPGMKTRLEHDWAGRMTRINWLAGGSQPLGIELEWDEASRLTGLTDPNGNKTSYNFDEAGNLVSTTPPDGKSWTRSFDSRGNCTGWKDANGTVVRNTYDAMNRLIRRTIAAGEGVSKNTKTEVYGYDIFGRLVLAKNDEHTIERSFEESQSVEKLDGREIVNQFDQQGRKRSVTYPSGYQLTFEYRGITVKISDAEGLAVEVDGGRVKYTRSKLKTQLLFGATGLPEQAEAAIGNQSILKRAYEWDTEGNLKKVERQDIRGKQVRTYGLDGAMRLVESKSGGVEAEVYELDAAGNRTSVRTGAQVKRYVMEGGDRAMNRYTSTPEGRCEYDGNGNLIAFGDASGERTMKYDYRNRMVEHRAGDGTVTRYTYDCLDRRLTKVVSKGRVRTTYTFVYDGMELAEVRNESSGTTQSLLRMGRTVYGLKAGEQQTWLICDAAGSLMAEVGADGKLKRIFDYGDFGEVFAFDAQGNSLSNDETMPPILFAGYTFDAETNFLKTNTRYLDPKMGRFTTPDPAGAWFDGMAKGNAYVYAANNPITLSDPSGLSTYRTYSCGGPWPGPRQIMVEFEGCSRSRRDEISHAVCWAFRGSGQAHRGVFARWVSDISGQPQANRVSKSNLRYWFAGPDGAVSNQSTSHIASRFEEIFDATKSDDFDIDCENTSTCDTALAYVAWGGYDVNLCPGFWSTLGDKTKGYILIHELSHAYADTDDYTYYFGYPSNQPGNSLFETVSLRQNADTYGCFVRDVYL